MLRYQDAFLPDGVEPGERDCAERWELIAPYLPAEGLLLDVGSNLGYYGLRAVASAPRIAVISVESDAEIATRQRDLAVRHQTDRLCLVQGLFDSRTTAAWARTCDWIDLTLLLGVLHWFDDPAAVLRDLATMSSRLIVELPDAKDRACGRSRINLWADDPAGWVGDVTGRQVVGLGRVARHTSAAMSHLLLIEGPVSRMPTRPYWDAVFPHPEANDYRLDFDGRDVKLEIRGKVVDRRPGINLVSLMKLGRLRHPDPSSFVVAGTRAIEAASGHGDPYPHNMLWSAAGIELIDSDDQHTDTAPPTAVAMLEQTIAAWAEGRTISHHGYMRELLGPARYVRRRAGRVLRRLTSDDLVEALKVRLGL